MLVHPLSASPRRLFYRPDEARVCIGTRGQPSRSRAPPPFKLPVSDFADVDSEDLD